MIKTIVQKTDSCVAADFISKILVIKAFQPYRSLHWPESLIVELLMIATVKDFQNYKVNLQAVIIRRFSFSRV